MKKVIILLLFLASLCSISQAQTPGSRPYPATSLDSPPTLFEVRDKAVTRLDSSISAVATTIAVESTDLFPSTGSLVLNKQEIAFYTGKTAKSFTGVIRAREGTAAVALAKGASVEQTQIAAHHNIVALQLIETQKKLGIGATLPALDYMLIGTGAGTSAWQPVPIDKLSDVVISSPSLNQVLKYDGTRWVNGSVSGSGTVTSIAVSAGGIFSFTGSPITSSGTFALAVTGTSGGIPYFSSGSALSSSGALAANRIILGGGAGSAPTALAFGTGNQLVGMNNGATANEYKNLAFGTSGTDVNIVHTSNLITFNLPTASGTVRGLLSNSDWTTFNSKLGSISTVNDTNITLSYGTGTLTAGWTGALVKNRQYSGTVYTDGANTFGNFVQTFQAGNNFLLSDPTDTTKKAKFGLSNITTGNTRTINVPDVDSTLVQASAAVSTQFITAVSPQGVISRAQPVISDISGLTAALAAKATDSLVVHLSGSETITGDKLSSGVSTFGIVPAAAGALGGSASALIMRGGAGTTGTPITVSTPGYYFELVKSGGTHGNASFGWNFHFSQSGSSGFDTYPVYEYVELSPDLNAQTDSVAYFSELHRLYGRINPSNISARSFSAYGFSSQLEKLTALVGIRGHYSELRNNSGTDADASVPFGSRNTSWAFVSSANGTNHNTGLIYHEGVANTSSAYYGEYWGPESVIGRLKDSTGATATLQGTWSATNGSATVTGTGGNGANECEQGAWLSINGTWARALSCSANSITLTTTFAGSSGSGLTISKGVALWWLREKQSFMAINHAGTSRLDILHVDELDQIRIGYSLVPVVMGAYTSYGSNIGISVPSDTLTTGWRQIIFDGGSGGRFGRGIESGYMWDVTGSGGYKMYVSSSAAPVLAFSVESTKKATFADDLTVSGLLKAGSTPTTLTDSAGKILAAALNTIPISTGISGLGTGVATFLATPSSANFASMITDESGTAGTVVMSNGAILVAPILGAATATSINKVAFTAPASGATLTIADGKTFTASNSLTLSGTDSSSVAFGGGGTIGAVGYSSVGQVAATATNDNAASGKVGELISSTITSGSAITLTSTVVANLTSVSLTAGDWDVWVDAVFTPGGTLSLATVSVSTTSAVHSFTPGNFFQLAPGGVTPGSAQSVNVGATRLSLSGTTTVYGVVSSTFGTSMTVYGIVRARRVR